MGTLCYVTICISTSVYEPSIHVHVHMYIRACIHVFACSISLKQQLHVVM